MTIKKVLIRINKRWLSSIDCSTYEQVLSAIDRASMRKQLRNNKKKDVKKRSCDGLTGSLGL